MREKVVYDEKEIDYLKRMRNALLKLAHGYEALNELFLENHDLYCAKLDRNPCEVPMDTLVTWYGSKFDELEIEILTYEVTESLMNIDADIDVRLEVYRRVLDNLKMEYGL